VLAGERISDFPADRAEFSVNRKVNDLRLFIAHGTKTPGLPKNPHDGGLLVAYQAVESTAGLRPMEGRLRSRRLLESQPA
jgi:hypothetical protein